MKKYIMTLALCSNLTFAADEKIGMADINMGDSFDGAKAILTTLNPDYKFSDIRQNDRVTGIAAITDKRVKDVSEQFVQVPQDESVVLKNDENKIWFVSRKIRPQANDYTVEQYVDKLKNKFHEPTTDLYKGRGLDTLMQWSYDKNGKLYHGPLNNNPCLNVSMGSDVYHSTSIHKPYKTNNTCGYIVIGKAHKDVHNQITSSEIIVLDAKSMFNDLMKQKNEQIQKAKSSETSKNNAPKI
jgi:hypothetical protein